ncbi:biotin/lipoyl-containing protein [Roseibium sp.]|uniref:biotin/lipoyl-containing protein n=1 Tax=Roseibium sp. TaxID=1936156 RepID=UPI003A9769A6
MPLDVIMPALGMAQQTGQIIAWHKKPGDAVAEGEVLFEVETDKAAMEVEALGNGFLTDVIAEAGADVPVGEVIARISDTPESRSSAQTGNAPRPTADASKAPTPEEEDNAVPEGHTVIMPTLGMAQDTGLLVSWQKNAGDAVAADDVLFEVETDKSTVEVNAGIDGFVAALLAEAGEDVPVGQSIAIISLSKPEKTLTRSAGASGSAPPEASEALAEAEVPSKAPATQLSLQPSKQKSSLAQAPTNGRILASPKVRRLALEQGLDLASLVKVGHPQPFHVKDLEVLRALPRREAAAIQKVTRHLKAGVPRQGWNAFADWAVATAGVHEEQALLAGFAAASFGKVPGVVRVETPEQTWVYAVSSLRLGQIEKVDPESVVDLFVHDLRSTCIETAQLGADGAPVLSLTKTDENLILTLEFEDVQMSASKAISAFSDFAGRLKQPLRHLL